MARKNTPHLLLRDNIFYFRARIPSDLTAMIGLTEIRKSLETGDKNKAIIRSKRISAGILEVFEQARMSNLTRSELKSRLQKVFDDILEIQRKYIDRVGPKSQKRVTFLLTISKEFKDLAELIREGEFKAFKEGLMASPYEPFLTTRIERARVRAGYPPETASLEKERVLMAEILDMLSDYYREAVALHKGERSYTRLAESNPSTGSSVALTMAISGYVGEKMRAGVWTEKTKGEMEGIFGVFLEATGNLDLEEISRGKATEFKDILLKLPRNLKMLTATKYEGMAIREVADLGLTNTLSVKTINKYLMAVSGIFDWGIKQGYCTNNYFKPLVLSLGKGSRITNPRDIFTGLDLTLIETMAGLEKQEWKKWVVLIGMYSGMRLNEICQLYLDDVAEVDGVLCFKVTDEREDQKLKNAPSKRLVPVHSKIAEGLKVYVKTLKVKGKVRLFPEFKLDQNGYGSKTSKWFNRTFKNKLGITDKGKVFHSFRHTFITALKRQAIEETLVKALVGHTEDSMTYGHYGRGHEIKALRDVIEKI